MLYTNTYLQKMQELCYQNKHLVWYSNIIQRALLRATTKKAAKKLLGYVEGHHILPRGFDLGGEKDKSNYAYLTAREHFICHWLLINSVVDQKHKLSSMFAMYGFQQNNKQQGRRLTSWEYERLRKIGAEASSISNTGRKMPPRSDEYRAAASARAKGKPSKLKGIIVPSETVEKLKEAWVKRKARGYKQVAWNKGVPRTDEQKKSHSEKMKGKQSRLGAALSEDTKQKIGDKNRGKVPHNKGVKDTCVTTCLCCKREITGASNFSRWHGINCRS